MAERLNSERIRITRTYAYSGLMNFEQKRRWSPVGFDADTGNSGKVAVASKDRLVAL